MITLYEKNETNFGTLGLGTLLPYECKASWEAGGMYEITLVHPIDDELRWSLLTNGRIIKCDVPVRESPVYDLDSGTVSETRSIYKVNIQALFMRNKPSLTGSSKIGCYYRNTEVVLLEAISGNFAHVVTASGGKEGYMWASYLTFVRDEVVYSGAPVRQNALKQTNSRDQLFRIYSVETDTANGCVTVKAMHVFYDLRGNILNKTYEPSEVGAKTAAGVIFAANSLLNSTDFTFHYSTLSDDNVVTADWSYKGIVDILLDPDEGLVAQGKCRILRDNFDVFLLPDETRDMGVTIMRGKNLLGASATTDMSDVVTRIVPCGKKKNGDPLFIDAKYIDSPDHFSDYPLPLAQKIDYDVKVVDSGADGKKTFSSEAAAKAKLTELANKDFTDGCDLPSYTLDVDFVQLKDTGDDLEYESLQAIHPYDSVHVIDSTISLSATVTLTAYEWDVIAQRYNDITLGDISDVTPTTYSYELPTNGISGTKISGGTLDGSKIRSASITYAEIADAAITTAKIDDAAITNAKIADAAISTAKIDSATVTALKVDDYIYASKGVFERICIKAEDGNYYKLTVDSNGYVSTAQYSPTASEIAAGATVAGQPFVATELDRSELITQSLKQTEELYNKLLANQTDTSTFFSRSAVIQSLRASTVGSLNNGSNLTLTEEGVSISTPYFEVNVNNSTTGEQMLTVDEKGVFAQSISGNDIEGLPAARRRKGDSELTVTDLSNIGAMLKEIQLDKDLTISLNYTTYTELSDALELVGLSGSGKLIITNGDDASGHNVRLLGGVAVRDCSCQIEFRYITSNYQITRSPRVTFTECEGSGGQTTVVHEATIQAHTTAYYSTYGGGFSSDRTRMFQGNGRYAACAWFDLSSIPSNATLYTGTTMAVRFKRKSQGGNSAILVGYTSRCKSPSDSFSTSGLTSTGVTQSGAKESWIELSEGSTTFTALRSGCYVCWTPADGSQFYADLYGASSDYPPEIKIKYTYTTGTSAFSVQYTDTEVPVYLNKLGVAVGAIQTATNCSYIDLGQLRVAWGSGTTSSDGATYTNVYADLFAAVPIINATWSKTGASDSGDWGVLKIYLKTANGFTIAAGGNNPSSEKAFDWVAIGQRATS